jgi:shikimate dehydrogenase
MEKYGIIGYPLSHSISPQIHNLAFQTLNINAVYEKAEINPSAFDDAITRLKTEGWKGFNVTIPFKEKIIGHLDEVDAVSSKIGAINTVKAENGKWKGYNTDYLGFMRPLISDLERINSALILGAGGASRAVIFGLLEKSNIKNLFIANRTKSRAEKLLKSLDHSKKVNIDIISLSDAGGLDIPVDLIVNTTSVGMGNLIDDIPAEIPKKFNNFIVYDLIYNPKKSKLLQLAQRQGCKTINGLPMLIYQAEESFKIWTGKHFPEIVINNFLS